MIVHLFVVLITNLLEIYPAGAELKNTTNARSENTSSTNVTSKKLSVASPPLIWILICLGIIGIIIIVILLIYKYRALKKTAENLNIAVAELIDLNENSQQQFSKTVSPEKSLLQKIDKSKEELQKEVIIVDAPPNTELPENTQSKQIISQDISSTVCVEETTLLKTKDLKEKKQQNVSNNTLLEVSINLESKMLRQNSQESIFSEDCEDETLFLNEEKSKVSILHSNHNKQVLERETSNFKQSLNTSNVLIRRHTSLNEDTESIENMPHKTLNSSQKHGSINVSEPKMLLENEETKEKTTQHVTHKTFLEETVIVDEKDLESERCFKLKKRCEVTIQEQPQNEKLNEGPTQNTSSIKDIIVEKDHSIDKDSQNYAISIKLPVNTSNIFMDIKESLPDVNSCDLNISEELNTKPITKSIVKNAELQLASLESETEIIHSQLLNKTVPKLKPKSLYFESECTMVIENEKLKNESTKTVPYTDFMEEDGKCTINSKTKANNVESPISEFYEQYKNDSEGIKVTFLDPATKKLHLQLLAKSVQKYREKFSIEDGIESYEKPIAELSQNPHISLLEKDLITEREKCEHLTTTQMSQRIQHTFDQESENLKIDATQNAHKTNSVEKAFHSATDNKINLADANTASTKSDGNNFTKRKSFTLINPKNIKYNLELLLKNIKKRRKAPVDGKPEEYQSNLEKNSLLQNDKTKQYSSLDSPNTYTSEKKLILNKVLAGESLQNDIKKYSAEEISNEPFTSQMALNEVKSQEEKNCVPISKRISKIAGHQFRSLDPETKKIHLQLLTNSVQKFKEKKLCEDETLIENSEPSKHNFQIQTTAGQQKILSQESENLKGDRYSLEGSLVRNNKLITNSQKYFLDTVTLETTSDLQKPKEELNTNTIYIKEQLFLENENKNRQDSQYDIDKDSEKALHNPINCNKEINNLKTSIETSPELTSEPKKKCSSKNKGKEIQFASLDPQTIKLHLQLLTKSVQKFKRESSSTEQQLEPNEEFIVNTKNSEEISSKTLK